MSFADRTVKEQTRIAKRRKLGGGGSLSSRGSKKERNIREKEY